MSLYITSLLRSRREREPNITNSVILYENRIIKEPI